MFLLQIQVLQQMLPFLRLDGYYVVSDLVGVPDLFRRIGPVLRSAIPFHKPEPEVAQLKPWVRRAVTGWVLVIVPVLLLNLGYLLLAFPRIAATSWDSASRLLGQLGDGGPAADAWIAVQLLLLVLPAVGITFTMTRTARRATAGAWSWSAGSSGRRSVVLLGGAALVAGLALAWWPDGRVTPYREGERGTIQQQVRQLDAVGTGRPLLRTPRQAQQPLPAVQQGDSAVVEAPASDGRTSTQTTTTETPGATDTAPEATAVPSAEASTESSPAPEESAGSSPSPAAEQSADPSPSPTP
jgi:putative peptide zinc metalloprotease protein